MNTITPAEMDWLMKTHPVELIDLRPKKDFENGARWQLLRPRKALA